MNTFALPVRPDLEHLRREAKQLLQGLRAHAPAAVRRVEAHARDLPVSLSTTQLVVAREYGFDSWPQLKQLVTRMNASGVRYDSIGHGYADYRRADPRIAAAILTALGDSRTVVNVGAGTGSYEPTDRPVVAVEPSTAMALQRDPSLSPAVLGVAESLPLADDSTDAAMAVMTMQHWSDAPRGLAELKRVARRRVVLVTIDPTVETDMWLFADYAPEFLERDRTEMPAIDDIVAALGAATVTPLPIPHDCTDGMGIAFWSRPEAVLDPRARAATSGFARMDNAREAEIVARLADDLRTGAWDARHGHLRALSELDVGLRLITVELDGANGRS
jgi:SAM-dependent methyltransferase